MTWLTFIGWGLTPPWSKKPTVIVECKKPSQGR